MRIPGYRRVSFRTRLTITITLVFVVAGVGLLGAQYAALNWMLGQTITAVQSDQDVVVDEDDDGLVIVNGPAGESGMTGVQQTEFAEQTSQIAADVVQGVMVASAVILAVFVLVAAGLGSWLSRRATRRIAEVSAATREISEHDLRLRLALPGPTDEVTDLGDTIDEMLSRLESAFASQNRFIANASHELRTPLATTRTALQVPLRQGRVSADLVPDIERALAANRKSEQLIEALLVLARGRFAADVEVTEVSLDHIVREELDTSGMRAKSNGLSTTADILPVAVRGHGPLLAQAVHNLVDNAIKHNTKGGTIAIRLSRDEKWGRFEITNSGEVIDQREMELLTEPFHRGTASRLRPKNASPGLGLGLSIVSAIADVHQGRLVLSSLSGGGLSAILEVPLEASAAASDQGAYAPDATPEA